MNSITGMTYYSLEYLRILKKNNYKLIFFTSNEEVRKFYSEYFPDSEIINSKLIIIFLIKLIKKIIFRENFFIYTPTSHPIPFIRKQITTLHDTYVFENGLQGFLKDVLFKIAIYSSNSTVGFVNKTFSGRYLLKNGFKGIYLPNLYNNLNSQWISNLNKEKSVYIQNNHIKIALTGTSCLKKNHQNILSSSISNNQKFVFYIYGCKTKYLNYLLDNYPLVNIKFVNSNEIKIEEFIKTIDILLIQNIYEGFCRPVVHALANKKIVLAPEAEIYREFYNDCLLYYDSNKKLTSLIKNILNYNLNFLKSEIDSLKKIKNFFSQLVSSSNEASLSFLDHIKKFI